MWSTGTLQSCLFPGWCDFCYHHQFSRILHGTRLEQSRCGMSSVTQWNNCWFWWTHGWSWQPAWKVNVKLFFTLVFKLQLNRCETDLYFLQNFQCTTMLIYAFCKSCEHGCEPEIVQKNQNKKRLKKVNKNNFTFTTMFETLTKSVNQHCRALEFLKKI